MVWMLAPSAAHACGCTSVSNNARLPCKSFEASQAVFSGKAVRIVIGPHEERIVTFEVTQPFRGVTDKTVEVLTWQPEFDCSYVFSQGESYLVYAVTDPGTGKLSTNICTRTKPLSQAKEDLEFLTKKDDPAHAFGIVGVIYIQRRDAQNKLQISGPAGGVTVVVSGVAVRVTATTHKDGSFEFWGLQPGSYRVSPMLGEEFMKTAQTVRVGGDACEGVDFYATPPPRKNP